MHPSERMCAEYFEKIFKPLIDSEVTFWIAGGAIRSWFQTRTVTSDIDVWFPSEAEWIKAKAVADKAWKLTKETPASANYSAGKHWIQLVRKHYFKDSVHEAAGVQQNYLSAFNVASLPEIHG